MRLFIDTEWDSLPESSEEQEEEGEGGGLVFTIEMKARVTLTTTSLGRPWFELGRGGLFSFKTNSGWNIAMISTVETTDDVAANTK